MAWTTEHVTFKAVFCSTQLQTQACMTVVSCVTLSFVDCASLLAFWVKKSKQWPVHDTRSVSNAFSYITVRIMHVDPDRLLFMFDERILIFEKDRNSALYDRSSSVSTVLPALRLDTVLYIFVVVFS